MHTAPLLVTEYAEATLDDVRACLEVAASAESVVTVGVVERVTRGAAHVRLEQRGRFDADLRVFAIRTGRSPLTELFAVVVPVSDTCRAAVASEVHGWLAHLAREASGPTIVLDDPMVATPTA